MCWSRMHVPTSLSLNAMPIDQSILYYLNNALLYGPPDFAAPAFDPEQATEILNEAGFESCAALPTIRITAAVGTNWYAEDLAEQFVTHLGCNPSQFEIKIYAWDDIYSDTQFIMSDDDLPHLWLMPYGETFPDPHFALSFVYCEGFNLPRRPCTQVDELIAETATTLDRTRRAALFREIEATFFGPNGELPAVPVVRLYPSVWYFKPWFTGPHDTDGIYDGIHWDAYRIDMQAKLAARAAIQDEVAP